MSWIVQQKENAEKGGADPEEDFVMFAITPRWVAEVYNRHKNEVDEDHEEFRDLWEKMTQETREKCISAVEHYINKRLSNIDEDIMDTLDGCLRE